MEGCSLFIPHYTWLQGSVFSRFDTISKEACFLGSLVDHPLPSRDWDALGLLDLRRQWKAEELGPPPLHRHTALPPSLPFRMQDSLGRVAFWCSYISKFLSDNSIREMSQLKNIFLIFFGLTVLNKKINLLFSG